MTRQFKFPLWNSIRILFDSVFHIALIFIQLHSSALLSDKNLLPYPWNIQAYPAYCKQYEIPTPRFYQLKPLTFFYYYPSFLYRNCRKIIPKIIWFSKYIHMYIRFSSTRSKIKFSSFTNKDISTNMVLWYTRRPRSIRKEGKRRNKHVLHLNLKNTVP